MSGCVAQQQAQCYAFISDMPRVWCCKPAAATAVQHTCSTAAAVVGHVCALCSSCFKQRSATYLTVHHGTCLYYCCLVLQVRAPGAVRGCGGFSQRGAAGGKAAAAVSTSALAEATSMGSAAGLLDSYILLCLVKDCISVWVTHEPCICICGLTHG